MLNDNIRAEIRALDDYQEFIIDNDLKDLDYAIENYIMMHQDKYHGYAAQIKERG